MKCYYCMDEAIKKKKITLGWSGTKRNTGYRGLCSKCTNEAEGRETAIHKLLGFVAILVFILFAFSGSK